MLSESQILHNIPICWCAAYRRRKYANLKKKLAKSKWEARRNLIHQPRPFTATRSIWQPAVAEVKRIMTSFTFRGPLLCGGGDPRRLRDAWHGSEELTNGNNGTLSHCSRSLRARGRDVATAAKLVQLFGLQTGRSGNWTRSPTIAPTPPPLHQLHWKCLNHEKKTSIASIRTTLLPAGQFSPASRPSTVDHYVEPSVPNRKSNAKQQSADQRSGLSVMNKHNKLKSYSFDQHIYSCQNHSCGSICEKRKQTVSVPDTLIRVEVEKNWQRKIYINVIFTTKYINLLILINN